MAVLLIALRNFMRQSRRYIPIFLSAGLGLALILLVWGLSFGLSQTMEAKAARYFAGDISIIGYSKSSSERIDDEQAIISALKESKLPYTSYTRRTNYLNLDATLFFNGNRVKQRRLVGVDFSLEKDSFSKLDFVSGDAESMLGSNGILVSTQVAVKTGVRVGDDMLLLLTTRAGAQNTARMIVKGIYRESSFFGSTTYLDIETLNALIGQDPGSCTDIGIMLPQYSSQQWAAGILVPALREQELQVFDPIDTREGQLAALSQPWEGRKYTVMTLKAHLSTVNQLVEAIGIVAIFISILIFIVVAIGISNTYRLIVVERTKELGTLRALGMQSLHTVTSFVSESFILWFCSALFGAALSVLLIKIVSLIDLSMHAAMLLFLNRGRLDSYLPFDMAILAISILLISCVVGVLGPAYRASKIRPIQAIQLGM